MRLEYEIATTGRDRLIRETRSIEQELEKQARRGVSRESKTETARVRLRQTGARQRLNADEMAAKKAAQAEAALAKMGATAKIREERRVAQEQARLLRWRQGIQNRHFQQMAMARKRDEMSAIRSEQRKAQAAASAHARTAARYRAGMGRVASGSAGLIGGGIRTVGSMVGIAGGLIAGNAVSNQISEQARASKLANQAGTPGIKGELLKEAQGIKGFTGEEALGGLSAFAEKTGDLESGRALLSDMSRMALAFDTNLEDMGRTAGQAFTVLSDQVGPQEAIRQTSELLKTLAQQGNLGAVEMSDLARVFGKLGAATRSFEGGAPELLRQMGAFAQIAVQRGGASSSEEAATAASRLAQDMVGEKRSKFERILGKGGLQSKTDKTKLRDPLEIMIDVLNKTGGDIMKTGDLFGGESKKIFAGLSSTYSSAEATKKGSGEEAVRKEFERFAGATKSNEQIDAAVQSRMEDPDIQLKETFKKLNAAIGEKLVPEIMKLIPKISEAIPHVMSFIDKAIAFGHQIAPLIESLAGIVGTLVENDPFDGLGVIVGGLIAKELVGIGASAVVEAGMAKLLATLAARAAGDAGLDLIPTGDGKSPKKGGGIKTVAKVAAGAAMLAGTVVAGSVLAGAGQEQAEKQLKYRPEHSLMGSMFANSPYASPGMYSSPTPAANAAPAQDKPSPGPAPGAEEFLKAAQETNKANELLYLTAKQLNEATRNTQNGGNRNNPIVQRSRGS